MKLLCEDSHQHLGAATVLHPKYCLCSTKSVSILGFPLTLNLAMYWAFIEAKL